MIIYLFVIILLCLTFVKKNRFIKEYYNTGKYSHLENIRSGLYSPQINKNDINNNIKCVSHIKPIIYTKGYLLEKPTNLVSFDNLVSSQKYFETGNYKWK